MSFRPQKNEKEKERSVLKVVSDNLLGNNTSKLP